MSGISYAVFDSFINGENFIQKISPQTYSDVIKADGGYWQASTSFAASRSVAESWFENGLNRTIKVYNNSGSIRWEGFVNKVTINLGPLTITRGPLLESSNKVRVVYPPVNGSIYPPVVAPSISSNNADDTTQQSTYGIIESILSNNPVTQTEAEQVRDTFLQANKDPKISQQINLPATQQIKVTLECLGFVHWLKAYTYSNTTIDLQDADEKIRNVISADPNGIISTDFSNIATNTFQVLKSEAGEAFAMDIIKEVVAYGDGSNNRYTFGIYADRIAKYQAQETSLTYEQKLSDAGSKIKLIGSGEVKPWDVLPGKWLFISDFLVGRALDTVTLTDDPRNLYIEEVRFTAPYQVNIVGRKPNGERPSSPIIGDISSRLGLTGVG